MPELPEVERATRLLNALGADKKITKVETADDTIVYSGVTSTEFAACLTGRKVIRAHRYGKVFFMELNGDGKHPVMHFGMTGMLHVKGQSPTHYREAPSDTTVSEWPPRWMKFILHLTNPKNGQTTEIAFRDARRLGRIRLCASPRTEPPISELGFDPLLSMPTFSEFLTLFRKRRGIAIKVLLLDQTFSAGVGNWVADEVLYHARIHPEQRCNTLSQEQLQALHEKITYVCETATSVDADDSQFPDNWLFKHRWGKGNKKRKHSALTLPSGEPATIEWVTVGGRTSAYVPELQKLVAPSGRDNQSTAQNLPLKSKRRNISQTCDEEAKPSESVIIRGSTRHSVSTRLRARTKREDGNNG
ncbi:hypothetical protein Agabi119p4_711 [Agaricus bisporus var. burnettii]|uniref:Formamidopyrimidine-DNA glycosylase catalytic domain-containing protein n=1 Tax=Agaricus bisporus var. burnettii TaxID=192524 RepID=A0A8H7FBE1_AGABI|nr:hypothetical protein Agabi119p4_711 [Agaricus bisporus var. burnettii]